MTHNRVDQFASLINTQIDIQTKIQDFMIKIEAMADVALSNDFLDCGQSTVHSYLWALYDLISESKELQHRALDELIHASIPNCFSPDELRAS